MKRPIIKWVGGKYRLIGSLEKRNFFVDDFDRYIEPMVGGGSVFMYVAENYDFDRGILNDINPDVIGLYKVIRDETDLLLEELDELVSEFRKKEKTEQEKFYYKRRKDYNQIRESGNEDKVRKTALLIFLDRTCYNGLYRENSGGNFNSAFWDYDEGRRIYIEEDIRKLSDFLDRCELYSLDFAKLFAQEINIGKEDFVFFDPPYLSSEFDYYQGGEFEYKDHRRLFELSRMLTREGNYVIACNSDSDVVRELYSSSELFNINRVSAKVSITCNPEGRGSNDELVICGNIDPGPRILQKTLRAKDY